MIKPLGLYKSQQTSQVKVFIFECGSSEQISEARSIHFIKTCFKLGVNVTTALVLNSKNIAVIIAVNDLGICIKRRNKDIHYNGSVDVNYL